MKPATTSILLLFTLTFSLYPLDNPADKLKNYLVEKPQIFGKSALTIDIETNEIIFAKSIDRKMYPASTTKLVTAVLLARNKNREDVLIYSTAAKASYPYKLDLNPGTRVKAAYAMEALLLFSANDIAYMIGENIDGNIEQFAYRMNNYAKELGLENTSFVNPSGLHSHEHYSSAYDLSIIARDVYHYPWVMETMGKRMSEFGVDDAFIHMKNRNKLVLEHGCIGGKTGWTPEAGRCLVALYERNERRIAGIVLGSQYNTGDTAVFEDMEKIIDYSYTAEKKELIKAYSKVKSVRFSFRLFPFFGPKLSRTIGLQIKESVYLYISGEIIQIYFIINPVNIFNLDKHLPQGKLILKQREKTCEYTLYPDVNTFDLLRRDILPFYTAIIAIVLILIFLILIIRMVSLKNNRP